jgi:hypothetical protein
MDSALGFETVFVNKGVLRMKGLNIPKNASNFIISANLRLILSQTEAVSQPQVWL